MKDNDKPGYRNPPKHTRFGQPGVDNKRGGRPRKQVSQPSTFDDLINEIVVVNVGGKPQKMPVREAAERSFISKGINGTPMDAKRLLDRISAAAPVESLTKQRAKELEQEIHQKIADEMRQSGDRAMDKLVQMRQRYLESVEPMEDAEFEILKTYPELMSKLVSLWDANRYHAYSGLHLMVRKKLGMPDGRSFAEIMTQEGGMISEAQEQQIKERIRQAREAGEEGWEVS